MTSNSGGILERRRHIGDESTKGQKTTRGARRAPARSEEDKNRAAAVDFPIAVTGRSGLRAADRGRGAASGVSAGGALVPSRAAESSAMAFKVAREYVLQASASEEQSFCTRVCGYGLPGAWRTFKVPFDDVERTDRAQRGYRFVGAVLRRRRPLDDAIEDNQEMAGLPARDRAFRACSWRRAAPGSARSTSSSRTASTAAAAARRHGHDMLRLGSPSSDAAAGGDHVDLGRGARLPLAKLVNAVLRRLSQGRPALVQAQDAARLNTPDWLWRQRLWRGSCRGVATGTSRRRRSILRCATKPRPGATPRGDGCRPDAAALGRRRHHSLPGYAEGPRGGCRTPAAAIPARLFGPLQGKAGHRSVRGAGGRPRVGVSGARVTGVDRSTAARPPDRQLARLHFEAHAIVGDAAIWRPARPRCCSTRLHRDRRHFAGIHVPRLKTPNERSPPCKSGSSPPPSHGGAGGMLVYCTCSLEPEEGPTRSRACSRGGPMARSPSSRTRSAHAAFLTPEGNLRTLPEPFSEVRRGLTLLRRASSPRSTRRSVRRVRPAQRRETTPARQRAHAISSRSPCRTLMFSSAGACTSRSAAARVELTHPA